MTRVAAVAAAAAVVLGTIALAVPGTSSGWSARIGNSTDSAATKPGFACADVLKAPAADGLSALFVWPLTETSGTTAADLSGYGHAGTYSGTSASATGTPTPPCPRDPATSWRTFTGGSTSGPYVYYPAAQTLSGAFSVEVWVRTSTANQGVAAFTNSGGTQTVMLYITSTGKPAFALSNSAAQTITGTATVTDNAWHELVATFDPRTATSTSGSRLYVDGAQSATSTMTTQPTGTNYWVIANAAAASMPGAASGFTPYYAGGLRYAAVYTVALTQTQVTTHYSAGTGS